MEISTTIRNNSFVFDTRMRNILFAGMGVGVLSMIVSYFGDDEFHTRFWTNLLHNTVFFTGIAFTAFFFHCAQITAFAGWNVVIKRLYEAFGLFMGVGLVLVAIMVVGLWGHMHHLYHWNHTGIADPGSPIYDKIIAGKIGFLNPVFYTIGTLGFLAIWYYWALRMRQNSLDQDTKETPSRDYYKRERRWAASYLPIAGFLSTVFIWQLVMSIDSHWYSTMFAWYSTISLLLAALALLIMLILFLKMRGYLEYVNRDHLHDLGKFLFGISVFWMYLWFDQFMLIWYGNIGEETIYFKERMNHYPVLFWGNMLINFVTPFFILMRNDTKRKAGTLFFVALMVFFGHWWDFFYMIKPGARIAAHETREMIEKEKMGAITPSNTYEGLARKTAEPFDPQEQHDGPNHDSPATDAPKAADATDAVHDANHQAEKGHDAHAADHGHDAHGAHHGPDRSFQLGYSMPGFPELGTFIGFLSLFLFFFFRNLERAPLVPVNDPYLEESLHHATGAHIDSEHDGHDHHTGDHDHH
jgi:hypothetical protein